MTYVKQVWDDDNDNYPVSAARMLHIEDGVEAAHLEKNVFPESVKAVGNDIQTADAFSTSTWSTDVDFETRLTALPAAGAEIHLTSRGLGVGRVRASKTNLFPYGSGRAGFSGGLWAGRTSTISTEVGTGADGTDAIVATSTGASSGGGFGTQNGTTVPALLLSAMGLRAGDVISARYHLTVPAGATGRAQIRFYRGSTLVSETSQTATLGDGYRTITGLTVPTGADRLVFVTYTTSSGAGQTSRLSSIRIDYGSTAPTEYIDGAQAGGEWWGTADASPSSIGRVLGDAVIPARGQAVARHLGSGRWVVSSLGPTPDVMRDGDVLTVDRDNAQQGMLAPSCPWITTSTTALTANRAYLVRVAPSRDMFIRSIAFRVTTASGTDDPCDVGVYDATGARLASSGSVTGQLNVTGTRSVTVGPVALTAGSVYYVAIAANSTAALQRATVLADAYGTAMPAVESCYLSSAFPLPSSIAAPTFSDAAPILVVREFV